MTLTSGWNQAARDWLRKDDWPLRLGLSLTLVALLLQPIGDWFVRPSVLLLACAGLLAPRFRDLPALWLLLAVLAGWRVIADWPLADNHAYLLGYWCLAAFMALRVEPSGPILARTAGLLLGLVFLFATLWKGLTPNYVDGRFFANALVTDPRFEDFTLLSGGLDPQTLYHNRDVLELAIDARTIEPPAFRVLVNLITWWTLVIEGLLAVVWLLPARSLAGRQRHWLMVLFCVSTYAVATVAGFGWLIVAMAVTTLRVEQTRLAFLYLLSFALILVFKHVPIWSLIGAS